MLSQKPSPIEKGIETIRDFPVKEQKILQLERENKELIEELKCPYKVIDIQQTEITKGKDRDQEFLDNVLMLE
jgi:hypothetical protein